MIWAIPVRLAALPLALFSFSPVPTPSDTPFSNAHDLPEVVGWFSIQVLGPSSVGLVVVAVLFYKYMYKPMHDSGRW
jgi:hypothetical protein